MTYLAYWCSRCISCMTFNMAFLVVGIVIYNLDTSIYGHVIKLETAEWDKGGIVDMISITNNGSCPWDYETILGKFPGTSNYCKRVIGVDTVGECPRKTSGYTVYGLGELDFSIVNNQTLCIRRDHSLNYHTLAKSRGKSCSKNLCGSSNDTNKRFCLDNCPINSFQAYKGNGKPNSK